MKKSRDLYLNLVLQRVDVGWLKVHPEPVLMLEVQKLLPERRPVYFWQCLSSSQMP